MTVQKLFILIPEFLFMLTVQLHASPLDSIHKWDVMELSFISSLTSQNPSPDIQIRKPSLLSIAFTNQNYSLTKEIRIAGLWNGHRSGKVRLAPPEAGIWSWVSHSRDPARYHNTCPFYCAAYSHKKLYISYLPYGGRVSLAMEETTLLMYYEGLYLIASKKVATGNSDQSSEHLYPPGIIRAY